ncbi:MAG: hypothetical protein IPL28_13075 [Chloroflexi bacterium]|nr:hypothetical protein [Chloroflexota bacterium]
MRLAARSPLVRVSMGRAGAGWELFCFPAGLFRALPPLRGGVSVRVLWLYER